MGRKSADERRRGSEVGKKNNKASQCQVPAWPGIRRRHPKAVRVIRDRERRDKWQSVRSWMRIGAPYRCYSFVCGHILSHCRRGHNQLLREPSSPLIVEPPPLVASLTRRRSTVRIRFAMDPWGCFDGRFWRAIVLSTFAALRVPRMPFFFAPVTFLLFPVRVLLPDRRW